MGKRDWKEFRETGLFWFVNTILHTFGWALVAEIDENGNVSNVYPARVEYRGFPEKINTDGYNKIKKYLKDNIDEI